MKKLLIILFIFLAYDPSPSDAATLDTSFRFSTIETEHFSIHFHQGIEDIAQKAAAIAEEVHPTLVKEFNWEPLEKTQMVLIDDTDFTNGFATVLPYNRINVQVVPPSLDMTIGEYDDWLRMLIVHEYTHILTMDPARGYSRVTRSIFGKPIPTTNPLSFLTFIATAPPNVFMPSWWHEGMATWAETEYSSAGRGRSTFYQMIFRMAVADNNIPSIDQINGEIPYWPSGSLPYIFGLRLQKHIADEYGTESLGRLSTAHAGRFPYFINGATLRLFGRGYPDIYRQMVSDLKNEERKHLVELSRVPFTAFKRLNLEGEAITNPRYSPDGRFITVNVRDPHKHQAIMIADRDGKNATEVVRRLPSDHSISWSPDGGQIYFSQAEIIREYNIYQDLYSYDLVKRRLTRLTHGLRIKEPDITPDGKRFAVIKVDNGNQNLALLENDGNGYELTRLTDYKLIRLSTPRWSPDGGRIVFAVKDNDGKSGIHLYDVTEKTDTVLFENGNDNAYPVWSPDGKHIIYTSDETGVFNLFAWSMVEGKRYQITHMLSGAFQPDISPDGKEITFSTYDSKGFRVATIDFSPESWMTSTGPSIKPYWNEEGQESRMKPEPKTQNSELTSMPYSAVPTLLPRFWLPTLSGDHKGSVIGAFTAGQDAVGYNTYMAEAGYGTNQGYYDVTYMNDYGYSTFTLRSFARPVLYSNLLPQGDYYELNRSLLLSMSVPINNLESQYRFTLGYHLQRQEELENPASNPSLFEGRRDNVFAGIEYSNALKYLYSVSHEEGRRITLLHKYYSGETGSNLNSREYLASYVEYLKMSGESLRHHVLYLSLAGALSDGDRTLQQAFQLGGPPPQLLAYPLRGYPSRFATGQYLVTGTIEYRAPIKYIFHGNGTRPFFWDRLHGAVFTDIGEVWDDKTGYSTDRLKVGAGLEARMDMTLGYWLKITPTLGLAHGFNQDGETSVYFTIYTNL